MNSAPRRRIIFVALVIVLAIGSVSQPVLAQDPDPDVASHTDIQASIPQDICVDKVGTVKVRAVRTLTELNRQGSSVWAMRVHRPAITINATSEDENIATLLQSSQITGFDFELPGEVEFDFRGENEGTTQLTFTAPDLTGLVGEDLDNKLSISVKVINCKFKVKAIQQAIVAGGSSYNIVAMPDEVEITGDENGHFASTTPVNWVGAASNVGICSASINVASTTQANLTADMDESGQLTGSLSIEAPETMVTATCVGVSNTSQMALSADPLIFSVPSSGGVVKVAQGFVFETANMPGSAVIVVVPVEDEAAFIPEDIVASWDGFLSLFGVLLALH